MAEETFNWGVDTFNTSGNQTVIDNILNDEVVTASPNDVKPNDKPKEGEEAKEDDPKKKAEGTKDEPVESKQQKDILSSLFNEEEEEDDTDKPDTKKQPAPKDKNGAKDTKEKEETTEGNAQEEEEDTQEAEETPENKYSSLSADLIKLGLFEDNDELDIPESGEELLQRFQMEAQRKAQFALDQYLGRFGEDRRQLFDAIFNKNVDPRDYLKTYSAIESLSNLDLEKADNQERVVRQTLSNQGFDQADIDEEVERLKEYGDLEKVSKKYHKVLVANEAKELEKKASAAEQNLRIEQQRDQQYQVAVSNILNDKLKQRDFDGIPVTPSVAKDTYSFLTSKNWKLPSGELLTDFDKFILDLKQPEYFPLKVKIALLAKNNFDLAKVAERLQSTQSSELFDSIARQTKKTVNKKAKAKDESEDIFATLWGASAK